MTPPFRVQQAQAQAKGQAKPAAPAPVPAKPLPANSKWNVVKQPSVLAEIKKLGQQQPKPSIADQAKGAFGKKKRSLIW
jgi:hypothetical protein